MFQLASSIEVAGREKFKAISIFFYSLPLIPSFILSVSFRLVIVSHGNIQVRALSLITPSDIE